MSKLSAKWAAIRQIIKSENSIVISFRKDEFEFKSCGSSLMFDQLYLRIIPYVKNWYLRWLKLNSVDVVITPITIDGPAPEKQEDIPEHEIHEEIGNLKPSLDDAIAKPRK